jgi:hypothetical protein
VYYSKAKVISDMPWMRLTGINDVFHFVLSPDLINLKVQQPAHDCSERAGIEPTSGRMEKDVQRG